MLHHHIALPTLSIKSCKVTYTMFAKTLKLNHYDYTNYVYWTSEYRAWENGEAVSDETALIMTALEEQFYGL